MAKSPKVLFPKYAPDLNDPGEAYSAVIQNVLPRVDGYGPFQNFVTFTQALPAPCRGYFYARNSDGSISIFAGTATDLYELNNATFAWVRVSAGGSSYSNLVSTSNWQFVQFEATVIAVQINVVPQAFLLGSSTAFAALGGSPPQAGAIAVINGFVILSELSGNAQRLQWSDLYGITTWTAGTGYSDFQDLPDGGLVHGLSGGDNYGLVFQDLCIRSLIYAPGQAVVFDIVRIAQNDPIYAKYSLINTGEKTFYISAQGIKRIDPGGYPIAIGKGRVDDFLKTDIDSSNLQLVVGSADPSATRVYWQYKSTAGVLPVADKVLVYDWSIGEDGEFSIISNAPTLLLQYIASLARPGLALDALDAITSTPLPITAVSAGASGRVRLTLAGGLSNTSFSLLTQPSCEVYGVTGSGANLVNSAIPNTANGTWKFNIIDSTHIDLIGSAYNGGLTYTLTAAAIGGALDALPFSLDTISIAAQATISGFNSSNQLGFFTGTNMDAILETEEFDFEGDTIFCGTIRPITDAASALVSVVVRQSAQSPRILCYQSAVDSNGLAGVGIESRYMRGRLEIPQGAAWTYARGLQPTFSPGGEI